MTSVIEDCGPDYWAQQFGTNYRRFQSATGIHGLYKRDGKRLDLLAVHATRPGHGQFRKFMHQCQSEFDTVCVWVIGSEILADALNRYGFHAETQVQGDGEVLRGQRWDKA